MAVSVIVLLHNRLVFVPGLCCLLTQTSDTAINEQMSLLELRERLAAAQQREREEVSALGAALLGPTVLLCTCASGAQCNVWLHNHWHTPEVQLAGLTFFAVATAHMLTIMHNMPFFAPLAPMHVQEERRRERFREQRAAREASIASKVEQLSAIRRLASAQAQARKAAATTQRAQTAAAVMQRHEVGVLALSDRLDAKHAAAAAEAARLAAEQKRIRFEQMQNAAGASAVEAARFRWVLGCVIGGGCDCRHSCSLTCLTPVQRF